MERVLLVEHEPLFGEGLALLLEWRTGLGCVWTRSLAEARTTLEEAPCKPVCVVVDLDLPEGQATAVLEELDGVPVLAMIGGRDLQHQSEALGLGADEVLSKRSVGKIAAAVERLIGPRSITDF